MIQPNTQSSHKKQQNTSLQIKMNPYKSNHKYVHDHEYQKQNWRVLHNKSTTMGVTKVLPTIRQNQIMEKIKRQNEDASIFKKYFNEAKNANTLVNSHSSNAQPNSGAYSSSTYTKNSICTGNKQINSIRFSNILAETQKQNSQFHKLAHQNHIPHELKNSNNQIQISQFIPEQSTHPELSAGSQTEQLQPNNPNIFENINRIISCKKQTQSLISQLEFYIGIIDKIKKENKYYRNVLADREAQNKQLRDVIHDRDLQIISIKQERDRFARLYAIQVAKVCVLKDSCRDVIETKWGDFMQDRLYRQSICGQQEFQTESESQYQQLEEKQNNPRKSIEKNRKRMYQTSQSPSVSMTNKQKMFRNDNETSFYTNNSNYSHLLYDNTSYDHYRPLIKNKSRNIQRSMNPENEHRKNKYSNKNDEQSINISRLLKQQNNPTPNMQASNRKSGKIIKSKQLQNNPHSFPNAYTNSQARENLYEQKSNISCQQHGYQYEEQENLGGSNNQNYHYQKCKQSTYLEY